MNSSPSRHPSEHVLRAFGNGELDEASAETVSSHLDECEECLFKVASISSDGFLDAFRKARSSKDGASSVFTSDRATPRASSGPGASSANAPGATTTLADDGTTGSPPAREAIPEKLGNHPDYEILRELARGGMGVVYLARNHLMKRDEVLKVMGSKILERPGALERFQREIRLVARLRHPNIVTGYRAFLAGEHLVFAMEHVEGMDLARIVKSRVAEGKRSLPIGNACYYAYQAALALQHAHEHGIVHRDIKPANLMLAQKGAQQIIKVLDFGLSKANFESATLPFESTSEGPISHGEGVKTVVGQVLGTPEYIAPEQISDSQAADIRADIYSLGCTLYFLLSGEPPFRAQTLYDMLQAHQYEDAKPLNYLCNDVRADVAVVVAKMMAKDPGRRFQTPGELARALTPLFTEKAVAFNMPQTQAPTASNPEARASTVDRVDLSIEYESSSPRHLSADADAPAGPRQDPSQKAKASAAMPEAETVRVSRRTGRFHPRRLLPVTVAVTAVAALIALLVHKPIPKRSAVSGAESLESSNSGGQAEMPASGRSAPGKSARGDLNNRDSPYVAPPATVAVKGAAVKDFTRSWTLGPGSSGAEGARDSTSKANSKTFRVLLLQGPDFSWECRFLMRAFFGSPDIHVDAVVLRRPAGDELGELNDPDLTPGVYDVFVLDDLPATQLPARQHRLIGDAVRKGAGLIMLGGRSSFGAGGWAGTELADILPVEIQRGDGQLEPEGGIKFVPSPAGLTSSVLQVGANNAETLMLWAQMPPILRTNLFGKPRKGAEILAETPGPDVLPLMLAMDGPGAGRVIAYGGDTWVWARASEEGRMAHRKFWQQVIFWLTHDARMNSIGGTLPVASPSRSFPSYHLSGKWLYWSGNSLILAAEHDVRRETEKVMARFKEFCRLARQLKVAEEALATKKAEIDNLTREVEWLKADERKFREEKIKLSIRLTAEPLDAEKTRQRGQIKELNETTRRIVSRRKQLEADLATLSTALATSENFNEFLKQVDRIRDEYRQALSRLAQWVDETTRWYGDHANDAVIKAALESANKLTPEEIRKFGPSSELLEIVRVLKLHEAWVGQTSIPAGAQSPSIEPVPPRIVPPDFPTDWARERRTPDQ